MKPKNILLVHKKSAFELFGRRKDSTYKLKRSKLFKNEKKYFLKSHQDHYQTLHHIEDVLKNKGLKYKKVFRDRNINYKNYDFVITVGGDGTVLKAIEKLDKQFILGVNSAPDFSVGQLCATDGPGFEKAMDKVLKGKHKVSLMHRMELYFPSRKEKYLALNDCLIAHANPAHMSRYLLRVGQRTEKQRSSGIWISTAVGSTGAIQSAGGRALKPTDKKLQYLTREMYDPRKGKNKLKKGVLSGRSEILVTSLMHYGYVYIDGSRMHVKFPFGHQLRIRLSNKPIRTIKVK